MPHTYSIAMSKDGQHRVLCVSDTMYRPKYEAVVAFIRAAEEDGFKVHWIIPHGDTQ